MLSPTAGLLERYLDLLAARQRVTASNIANADACLSQSGDLSTFETRGQSTTLAESYFESFG